MAKNLRDKGYSSSTEGYQKKEEKATPQKTTAQTKQTAAGIPVSAQRYYDQKNEQRQQREAQQGPVSVLKAGQLSSAANDRAVLSEKKFDLTPMLKKTYGTYDNYLNGRMVTDSGFYPRPEVPFAVTNLYNQMNNARTLAETAFVNLADAEDKYLNTKKAQEIYKNAKPSFSAEMYSRVPSPLENDTVRNYETQFGLAQKAYNSYLDYAEQYGAAAEALQKADDEWRSHVRPKEEVQKDIDRDDRLIMQYQQEINRLGGSVYAHQQRISGNPEELARLKAEEENRKARLESLEKIQKELIRRRNLKREELEWSWLFEQQGIMQNEDFDALSAYDKNNTDEFYRMVNNDPLPGDPYLRQNLPAEIAYMNDPERAIYNYKVKTEGAEGAKLYYDQLQSIDLNRRRKNDQIKQVTDFANQNLLTEGLTIAGTILLSPARTLSWLGQQAEFLSNGRISEDAGYQMASYLHSAVMQNESRKIEEALGGTWGKVGSFAFQTGVSILEFLWTALISGHYGVNSEALAAFQAGETTAEALAAGRAFQTAETISLGIMGTSAAADEAIEAKERGLTDAQAWKVSTIAGIAEIFTEKVSIDALFKNLGTMKGWKYVMSNAIPEMTEEMFSEGINWWGDVWVSGTQSKWQQSIDAYKAQGLDDMTAFRKALLDKAIEIGAAGAGGFLSGAALAGMHLGKNSYIYNQTLKNTEAEESWVQSLIDAGKASKEGSRAFNAAASLSEKLDKGPVNLKDAMDAARVIDKAVDQDLMSRSAEVIGKRLLTEEGRPALETAIAVVEQQGNKYMQELASRLKTQENIDPTEAGQVFLEAERIYSSQTEEKTVLAPREVTEDMTELEKSAARAGVSEKVTRRMQGVSDALGREIRFYSKAAATYERTGKTYKSTENGYYDPETGILYVNANAKNPFMQVVSHELTHDLENTKAYGALQNAILDRIGNLDQKVQEKIQSYERQGVNMGADPETKAKNARYELVAEYVETQLLGNERTIRQVVKQNRSLGEWVRDQIDKVLEKLGNTREKEAARERRELRRIRDIYAQALREKNEGPKGLELPKVASRSESMTEEGNLGYHAGDLGKAEYLSTQGRDRGTGHFGTGTYFVGNQETVTKDSHYGQRPQHAVDFSDYNLYKVRNDRDGYRLHDALRVIDGGLNEDFVKKAEAGDIFALRFTDAYDIARKKFGEDAFRDKNLIPAFTDYANQNGIQIQSKEEFLKETGIDEDEDSYYLDYLTETIKEAVDKVNEEYSRLRDAYFNLGMSFHFDDAKINRALNKVLAYQKETPRYSRSDSYATVFMKAMGYDGVDVRGTGLDNTGYGSVIYDVKDDTVRYSYSEDAETDETDRTYLDALNKGDMETAQRMVDEAAEAAMPNTKVRGENGKLLLMHHGTDADFTVFDRNYIGQRGRFEGSGFNFTPYEGRARGYGKNVHAGYLNIESPLSATKKTISISKLADIIRNVDPTGDNIIANYARDTNDYGSESFVKREAMTTARAIWKWENNDVDIYSELSAVSPDSDSLIEYFSNAGYDGLIHYDEDGRIRTAVAFDSNQFKLTDPVTYDDNGNVIPLSERFNPGNEDIRYSYAEEEPQGLKLPELQTEEDLNRKGFQVKNGAVSYSYTTLQESDLLNNQKQTAKQIAKVLKISQKKANRYLNSVRNVAYWISQDRNRLDFDSAEGLSAFVSNTEYGGSFDFTTLCTKRRYMSGTISAIQRNFDTKGLTAEEFLTIRKMLEDKGYVVSCPMCYVEGSRTKLGEYAEEFRNSLNIPEDEKPSIADLTAPEDLEKLRTSDPEMYKQWEKYLKNLKQRMPKMYQARTAYNGEIMRYFALKNGNPQTEKVKAKNLNGGIRFQSFSDFEAVHLLDNMQVIYDMARVGLAGQAYTKMIDYVMAMGGTGLKINMSLVAKGVDSNGRIILDETAGMTEAEVEKVRNAYAEPVEGMDEETRLALRDSFSKNVGTILVVFDDAQLRAAMADERIDFIIPYHRSQWSKAQHYLMGMPKGAKSYTMQENEKDMKTGRRVEKNLLPNQYWNGRLSGKENAELYLQMCFKEGRIPKFSDMLHKNADGSYSLQENGATDGYWKLLSDYKMYDNEGNFAPQTPVRPLFDDNELHRILKEYEGGEDYPAVQEVVDEFLQLKKDGKEVTLERYLGPEKAKALRKEYQEEFKRQARIKNKKQMFAGDAEAQRKAYGYSMTEEETKGLSLPKIEDIKRQQRKNEVVREGVRVAEEMTDEDRQSTERIFNQEGKTGSEELAENTRPTKARRWLNKTLQSTFHAPEGMKVKYTAIIDRYADRAIRNGKLTQEDVQELTASLFGLGEVQAPADEYNQTMWQWVKNHRVQVTDEIKAEFGDDWEPFRKRAFAAGVYFVNDSRAISPDSWNVELSKMFPAQFQADQHDQRVILEQIVDAAEQGKDKKMSLPEYLYHLEKTEGANGDELYYQLLNKTEQSMETFAEMAGLETDMKEQRFISDLQEKTLKQLQWARRNAAQGPAVLKAAAEKLVGDFDILAAHAAKETRYAKKYGATYKDLGDILKKAIGPDPEHPQFFPSQDLQNYVARVEGEHIADMDVDDLYDLWRALVALRTEFENRKTALMGADKVLFEDIYHEAARDMRRAKGGYRSSNLLKSLNGEMLTPINVLERMGGWNRKGMWYQMAKQLEQGEIKKRAHIERARQGVDEFIRKNRKWYNTADGQGKNGQWIPVEFHEMLRRNDQFEPIFGDTVRVWMTPMQRIHMYLESKNPQNLLHMEGGRTFVKKDLYQKGDIQEAFAQASKDTPKGADYGTFKLAPKTVYEIIRQMTPKEMELARILEQYYNAQWVQNDINRTSNYLIGLNKSLGGPYAPIYTNQNYVAKEIGMFDTTSAGQGNMKSRVWSLTPSYNISAMEAFERSIEQTGQYVGLAIAERNWNMLLNMHTSEERESMKGLITGKWGEEGLDYVTELIKRLQGNKLAPEPKRGEILLDKLLSNYVGGTFGFNWGVAAKQTASRPMAAAILGWDTWARPDRAIKVDMVLVNTYTKELAYRSRGFANPETALLAKNPGVIQSNPALKFLFGGGQVLAMDYATVRSLWPWAENHVSKYYPDLQKGTEEQIRTGESPYYQKVAEIFEEAISNTQPMYDEMHRANIMKDSKGLMRAFTMFKTVPLQMYNANRQAWGEWDYAKRTYNETQTEEAKTEMKRAADKVARTTVATVVSNLMLEAITALAAGWTNRAKRYRDDEGELTAESFLKRYGLNLLEDTTGMVIYGKEATQLLESTVSSIAAKLTGKKNNVKWYDITTPGEEQLNDMLNATKGAAEQIFEFCAGWADVKKDGGDERLYLKRHAKEYAGAAKDLIEKTGKLLFGLPLENLEKYVLGGLRFNPELYQAVEDAFKTTTRSQLSGMSGAQLQKKVSDLFDLRGVEVTDDAAKEIARLVENGFTKAAPADTPASVKVNDEDYKLSESQKQRWETVWQKTGSQLSELIRSADYQNADDDTKARMIDKLYEIAKYEANQTVPGWKSDDKWQQNARRFAAGSGSIVQAVAWYGATGKQGVQDADKLKLLLELDWSDEAKEAMFRIEKGQDIKMPVSAMRAEASTAIDKMQYAKNNGVNINTYLKWLIAGTGDKDEKLEALAEFNVTDKEKLTIAGTIFSTWETTKDGKLTEYGKMTEAVDKGVKVNDYLKVYANEAMPQYNILIKNGVTGQEAVDAAIQAKQTKNEAESTPGWEDMDAKQQKLLTYANVVRSEKEPLNSLIALMGENGATKEITGMTVCNDLGIPPYVYVVALSAVDSADRANPDAEKANGSYDQSEVKTALDMLIQEGVSRDVCAALWQVITTGSPTKNPYGSSVGKQVKSMYEAKKNGGDNTVKGLELPSVG